ncbi:MAG: nucleoside-diphosphate sugar epimerase, partial [Candidatus Methanofastidiosa archaeon]|nr:nucleoside-diphosphate sugar epimerase [Candidatus Methanofastidiosa archaeon]
PGDVRDSVADLNLAKSIGYKPMTLIYEGLSKSLEAYKKQFTKE